MRLQNPVIPQWNTHGRSAQSEDICNKPGTEEIALSTSKSNTIYDSGRFKFNTRIQFARAGWLRTRIKS